MIAIALPSDFDGAVDLLARGRRLAVRFGSGWIGVLVQPSRHRFGRLARQKREIARQIVELASALGGEVVCRESNDVALALVETSRSLQARWLVIGPSRRPRLLRRLFPGTTERLLRTRRPFDLVIAHEGEHC